MDDAPAVRNGNIAQDVESTSVTVHFNDSHMRPKAKGVVTQNKMYRKFEPSLYARWQLLTPLCCSSDFSKGESVLWTTFVHQCAILEPNVLGSAVQEMRRQKRHFSARLLEPFIHCRAAQRHAATREGALPGGEHGGVAVQHLHGLRTHPQLVGDDLGKGGFRPLTVGRDFCVHLDLASWLDAYQCMALLHLATAARRFHDGGQTHAEEWFLNTPAL